MLRWTLLPLLTAAGVLVAPTLGWQLLALMAGAAGYAIDIALYPMLPCRKCKGSGKRVRPGGGAHGRCRRCKGGTKEFVRLGRRVYAGTNGRRNP